MYDPIHDCYTQPSGHTPEKSSSPVPPPPPPAPFHQQEQQPQQPNIPALATPDEAPEQPKFSLTFEFASEIDSTKDDLQSGTEDITTSADKKRKRDGGQQSTNPTDTFTNAQEQPTIYAGTNPQISGNQTTVDQEHVTEDEKKRLKRYERDQDRDRRRKGMAKEVKAGAFARREIIDDKEERPSANEPGHYRSKRRLSSSSGSNHYRYNERPLSPHLAVLKDPSPEPMPVPRSPPRKLKKPGARFSQSERDRLKEEQKKREIDRELQAANEASRRGVEEVVKAHYNAVPERGKDWRKTESAITGLRLYNNWAKSTLIQKFAANDDYNPTDRNGGALKVLDIGCGKGGDLLKWKSAPQPVELYVGIDSADISIRQAKDRYIKMRDQDQRRNRGRPSADKFHAEFYVLDAWTHEVPREVPLVRDVITYDGGFDVVSMMFCLHYAFESEDKIKGILSNVSNSLRRGGRFIGTIPSSDIIYENIQKNGSEFGNSIYKVSFPDIEGARKLPDDGAWRPAWGWKYSFFLKESVEDVPEYVIPWEAFRYIATDYGLKLEYKRNFEDIWNDEESDPIMSDLSERMGVKEKTRDRSGKRLVQGDEWDACKIYLGFVFRKL